MQIIEAIEITWYIIDPKVSFQYNPIGVCITDFQTL